MKKTFKIAALILFIIGLCSVQPSYGIITLVDDDVGVEYITSLNSFDDAMLITTSMEIPGQVASPLKYSIMVVYQDNIGNMDQKIWSEFTNDYLYGYNLMVNQQNITAETNSTNLTEISKQNQKKECFISASEYIFEYMGRYRLNIGDNLHKTIIC